MYSFAVTAYNEMSEDGRHGDFLLRCLDVANHHPQIKEIVVVHDGPAEEYEALCCKLSEIRWKTSHVYIGVNTENLGVFGNKLEAVARCTQEWVINCDSDNVMGASYINRVVALDKDPDTWLSPSFARCDFDYRGLEGRWTLGNIKKLLSRPMHECYLNTGNEVVHRETFMEVFAPYRGPRADLKLPNWLGLTPEQRPMRKWRLVFDALDSFIFNMLWLQAGKALFVVPDLEYDHHRSDGSDSNYARSPQEKERLGEILLEELKRCAG